ncbi:MAG: zinc ribbon domain-containing protein [Gemmatimonadetes bacterium]|nr:zinc ribbon domain-containing protein [Gemmatimonadota bacterium]
MDDVERMYRQLVRIIRTTSPQLLTQPFPVSDLYSTILPYRLHRRELGLETNQDYEMALLELLSGARGYLIVEDRMKQTLADSLKSASPDPALIKEFAGARIALAPAALRQLDGEAQPAAVAPAADTATIATAPAGTTIREATSAARPTASLSTTAPTTQVGTTRDTGAAPARPTGTTASAPATAARRPTRPITVASPGEECPHCKGELPAGRPINFCPHCGQDLTMRHCPACGSELEHEWKFCVTCGRAAGNS